MKPAGYNALTKKTEPAMQTSEYAPFRPLRILVVDDEPSVREVLQLFFFDDGHEVGLAVDGIDGCNAFDAAEWDVVITDRMMPRMNGDQFAAAIRERNPDVPIILVTGYADLMAAEGGKSPLFDMIIRKPFTRETLRAALAHVQDRMLAVC
jgi:CheY-like chemotaxis protein